MYIINSLNIIILLLIMIVMVKMIIQGKLAYVEDVFSSMDRNRDGIVSVQVNMSRLSIKVENTYRVLHKSLLL